MAGPKRKRVMEDFDPNKSDSEDENFDPSEVRPSRSSKKQRSARSSRPGRKRGGRYRGSDIDDDDDEGISDSAEDSFADDHSDEEDEDAPVNAAGRRARKAATVSHNYKESSEDDDEDDDIDVKDDKDADDLSAVDSEDAAAKRKKPQLRRIVKLKVPQPILAQGTRRSTRARSEDAGDFYELSTSGRHAVPSRESRSKSPETFTRSSRSSRAAKTLKKAPEPIPEATQESSTHDRSIAEDVDELSQDAEELRKPEFDDNNDENDKNNADDEPAADDAPGETLADEDVPAPTMEEDDEDDDVPIHRRTRGARAEAPAAEAPAPDENESDAGTRKSRRLTRKSGLKKSTQEPSSDFEPGDDSDEDVEMAKDDNGADDDDTPTPRGRAAKRSARSGRSSRHGDDSGDEELDLDEDELNEEARELRQSSRARRRPRRESPIVYQERTARSRAKVNYYMPPLTSANIEDDDGEEAAPTAARARRGRGGAAPGWERGLNTTFGPFGGGGMGSVLGGPWGTGAAGGAESDSSDDEMVHRTVAGNVGMTPTSAAPGGLIPGGQALNPETTPNVGKIKDRKALADADPLGVDLNVDFSKVGGLQGHIDQLQEMVLLPLLYPEAFTRFHVTPPRGVLFHGPPGTGKTLVARALANSVGTGGRKVSFYMRKGADALSKWVGEAEKQLRLLFEEARRTQPSIIFFDEIDGLAPVRSSKQEQIHASIVSTLLALMDGMDGRGQVIVIGATNRPDNIDPALRRPGRFDREFYFPLPDIAGRQSILNIHTKDWGLSDRFMTFLAEKTKGYGGADLRALCTEAALNSIRRTYPQIYSSNEKLIIDVTKIKIHASDFMMSIKKLIPSSERSATSGAKPLPGAIEPLLREQLAAAKKAIDELLSRKKKMTALEEAMYEQPNDGDHGFGLEALQQEFERSRIFRPRFIIYGARGMGQHYLSSAILHYFEGVHVQNFDLPSLLGDGRPMEQVIVGLFTEVRRHKPSVIYIPNMDAWYATLSGTIALITFQTMLDSIPPTDPILLLATAECDKVQDLADLNRAFFGFTRKNRMEIPRPRRANRMEFFSATLEHIKKKPAEFPEPENRKKRVLEALPLAPPIEPKPPSKEEARALQKKDHQLLNGLKIQLQPIMDQINRKYKKFRQPVIPPAQIDYLFAESDPNFVRPDLTEGVIRPYEIVKDKYGKDVLRDTATGKCYYNLETTTIEERLSNGFYARPKDFLFDIKALARDAKNIGDKERTLKANELLSNVEVDVASIENATAHVDWEALYNRQVERAKEAAEKERKRKAIQSITDRIQSDLAGNDSDSQGPVMLGEPVPGSRTTARFQVRSPLAHAADDSVPSSHPLSNGSKPDAGEDVTMSGVDDETQLTQDGGMGPPPRSQELLLARTTSGFTQISQRSAITSLPAGVSPSAVINEASTTKTSDPSTHRSSNWSTQLTNGNHDDSHHNNHENDDDIPDTLPIASQATSSDEQWPHSQAALARANMSNMSGSSSSHAPRASDISDGSKHHNLDIGNLLNTPPPAAADSARDSGSSSSQQLPVDHSVAELLNEMTDKASGCTIEQLEQINRDVMSEIWRTRGEWNRMKVISHVTTVFNDTIGDIEQMQSMGPQSQEPNTTASSSRMGLGDE